MDHVNIHMYYSFLLALRAAIGIFALKENIAYSYSYKMSRAVSNAVWVKYFGDEVEGKCYCCKSYIVKSSFCRGYLVNPSNGGSIEIKNQVPLCYDQYLYDDIHPLQK